MASAYGYIPPSFDKSDLISTSDKPVRLYFEKNGRTVGYQIKRVGSHQPKKDRNRKNKR
jgi:hypothetical protein